MEYLEGSRKMHRFKKTIVPEIKKEIEFTESQERLKEKYNIEKPNVVVVETSNAYKFIVNTVVSLVKLAATIALLVSAAVGLMTLIYPGIRLEFIVVMKDILTQLKFLLN